MKKLTLFRRLLLFATLLLLAPIGVSAQVTIGAGTIPQSFSVLELISNDTQGLRLPQMSTAERDIMRATFNSSTVSGSELGLMIYNTTNDCVEYWNGGRWISLCGTVQADDLPAPVVSPMGAATFCNAVNFTITRPAGWTDAEWAVLSAANITATRAGFAVNGSFSSAVVSGETVYYYSVPATDVVSQNVTLNFTGQVSGKTLLAMPSAASVTVGITTESLPVLGGQSCFDIAYVNEPPSCLTIQGVRSNVRANFSVSHPYTLGGTIGSGVTVQSITWSYAVDYKNTAASDAVSVFTPSAFSTVLASNKVDVTFNPALLTTALGDGGIDVIITATVTTTSAACGTAVYTLPIVVNIRDCACCGIDGVAISQRIGNNDYRTHLYMTNGVMRCWMVENSKEGTPNDLVGSTNMIASTHGLGDGIAGSRGYYYGWQAAQDFACPAGWSVPTVAQFGVNDSSGGLWTALAALPNTTPANANGNARRWWTGQDGIPSGAVNSALAGYRDAYGGGTWHSWGIRGDWWSNSSGQYFGGDRGGLMDVFTYAVSDGFSVRCIQNQ